MRHRFGSAREDVSKAPSPAVGERGTDEKEGMERMRKRELPGGIGSREVSTPRLMTHLLESGPEEGVPVLFVHGNVASSLFWPKVAPGQRGIVNAFSPKYCDLSALAQIEPRPDVLWVRGADDRTVSDTSAADFGYLGKTGMVPHWPGEEVYPPQPMVSQIRAVLEEYSAGGGSYREEVIADCGHTPHIERAEAFRGVLMVFLP